VRRRLKIALWVTLALGALAAIVVVGGGSLLLRSARGQAWVLARVERQLATMMADGMTLRASGLRLFPIGQVTVDSVVVRDASGAEVVALLGVRAHVAIAPLFDREVHLREVHVGALRAALVQRDSGSWNASRILADGDTASLRRAWRVRVDTLSLANGEVTVDRRDSLPSLPMRRSTLREISLALGPSTLSTDGPRGHVTLQAFAARVTDPLFARAGDAAAVELGLASGAGEIGVFADSMQLDFPRLRVGSSLVSLRGALGFAREDRDSRLALLLRADTIHLADVSWAHALLPRDGRGSAVVQLSNGAGRGEYRADVQSFTIEATESRVSGRLVALIGEAIEVRNLDATAAPLDLRLVRELFGDSSPPPPWDGALRGRLRAPGGPLDRFEIAPSTLEFEDRRVAGALSRFTIGGTLDLLADETTLRPLDVTIDSLDVRTVGAVTDVADSLRGFLSGRVRLDGALSDIAFTDLDLVHVDGALPVSHVRGEGRIGDDETQQWLEARLALDTVGVAAVGHPFTSEVLAGRLHGTLEASATGDSVALALVLSGEGTDLSFTGATSLDSTRLVLKGALAIWALDLRPFLPALSFPSHSITAKSVLGIDGPFESPSGPISFQLDSTSQLAGIRLREGHGDLVLEPGGIRVDTLVLDGPIGHLEARGRLSREPALRDTLRFAAALDSASLLRGFLPDSLAAAWADSIAGRATLTGIAVGSLDTLDVRAVLVADGLQAGSSAVAHLEADLSLDGLPSATHGLVSFTATDLLANGVPIASVTAAALVREAAWADASVRILTGDTLVTTARADIHWMGDSLAFRLDSLVAATADVRWALQRPATLFSGPDRFTVDSLELISREGARFSLGARLDSAGPISVRMQATRVPLAHARFTGLMPERVNGLLTLDLAMEGTRAAPEMSLTAQLDSTQVDGQAAPELQMSGRYAARQANVTASGRMLARDAFSLTAELPLDLTLEDRVLSDRLIDGDLYLRLVADGSPLAGLEALMPGVRGLDGGLDADLQVTGSWDALEPRGLFLVRDGAFSVPALGSGFRDLLLDVSLAPDSIIVHRARLADERAPNDTASVEGAITRDARGWRADLRTVARSLRVIDDPRVAEADVSWTLRLRGPLDSLLLGGDVFVPNANVYIGQQRRQILELAEDGEDESTASTYAPRLEGLRVRLGNEVRLRSPEANVQLTGEVAVVGTLDAPDVRGEIFAERGTYRLDLGLLQRTFQVDSGRVRMNGPLSIPPSLDIQTSYTVRQADREDVKIGARLTGTVDQPRLTLSSGDLGTTASETEIISYLLFGAPTFVLDGQSASAVRLATAALVPSLGGAAERALGARLPFLSELQVVTVAGDSPRDFTLNSFEGLLNSFALTAGTQIGTDSYLRLSGGVCRGENRAAQSLPAWFGIAAEYRPRERLSAELSLTPGSAPCNRIGTFTQIYQVGLDLFRDWRW
jgi:translocation and assembly module TamB